MLEAANAGAVVVPMPFLNQWKLKSAMTFAPHLKEGDLAAAFEHLQCAPSGDPTAFFGCINPWILGGASNAIDGDSASIPTRQGAVMWMHAGAFWNDESLGEKALEWVNELWAKMEPVLSKTALYNCPDLQLGSQLTDPPSLDYVHRYWSSATHDFVDRLIAVKNRYDGEDVFGFAQSIPLSMEPPDDI